MNKLKLLDKTSLYIAILTFFLSLLFLIFETGKIMQSLMAAILAAALASLSYLGIRLVYLTLKE
ncbi:hypothetical protein BN1013_02027 [Candidatus Rubidus massiliensis]|nr:MAG: hypothetical protein BGO10_00875 [Chlamydia sp. 32-24]CDZ81491.1 hypothetical protein BN1013_02027 [Candidatus Rubidus massiliensis]